MTSQDRMHVKRVEPSSRVPFRKVNWQYWLLFSSQIVSFR